MALYRFLFAPALLAAAVLHGAPDRASPSTTARPARVEQARPAAPLAPTPAIARAPGATSPRPAPAASR